MKPDEIDRWTNANEVPCISIITPTDEKDNGKNHGVSKKSK
jgi:hypothetical protein